MGMLRNSPVISVIMLLLTLTPARADEPAPPPGLTLSLGADWTSSYIFRGIPQENQGTIIQPYAGLGVRVAEGGGSFGPTWLNFNIWNSIHTGPTGHGQVPSNWYEMDLSVGVSTTVATDWTLALTYIAYTSPNSSFDTIHELDLSVSYDDTRHLGAWALHPRLVLAVELGNEADAGNSAFASAGTSSGVYLELGIAPQFALTDKKFDGPYIVLPVTAGFSLANYYEDSAGHDDFFGYADIGAELVLPLGKAGGGTWTLRAGPHVIFLGDNAAEIGTGVTGGDDVLYYGRIGISMAF